MEAWLRPRTTTNVPVILEVRQSHPEPSNKMLGLEVALKELTGGLVGYRHTGGSPITG